MFVDAAARLTAPDGGQSHRRIYKHGLIMAGDYSVVCVYKHGTPDGVRTHAVRPTINMEPLTGFSPLLKT